MKRRLILFMLLLTLSATMQAQQVYLELRQKAQKNIENPQTTDMLRQFSQFKLDALDYMAMKMREQMPDSAASYLDRQAFALHNFMNLYMQALLDNRNQPAAFQVKIIKLFMDASYSNPLFNDPDKELVLSYYSEGKSLTRFSLDTDWQRAVLAANSQLKKIK